MRFQPIGPATFSLLAMMGPIGSSRSTENQPLGVEIFMNIFRLLAANLSLGLSSAAVLAVNLLLSPASAHAQGGVPLWTNTTPGEAIATDNNGNVFVTGSGSVVVKYSAAGM